MMIACLRLINFESTFSNKYGYTANTNGVCIDTSLHLEDSSNVQTISGMLHQLMSPRGEYLKIADVSKIEYINKGSACHTIVWCFDCTTKHF